MRKRKIVNSNQEDTIHCNEERELRQIEDNEDTDEEQEDENTYEEQEDENTDVEQENTDTEEEEEDEDTDGLGNVEELISYGSDSIDCELESEISRRENSSNARNKNESSCIWQQIRLREDIVAQEKTVETSYRSHEGVRNKKGTSKSSQIAAADNKETNLMRDENLYNIDISDKSSKQAEIIEQLKLYRSLIGTRLYLEKSLSKANCLPPPLILHNILLQHKNDYNEETTAGKEAVNYKSTTIENAREDAVKETVGVLRWLLKRRKKLHRRSFYSEEAEQRSCQDGIVDVEPALCNSLLQRCSTTEESPSVAAHISNTIGNHKQTIGDPPIIEGTNLSSDTIREEWEQTASLPAKKIWNEVDIWTTSIRNKCLQIADEIKSDTQFQAHKSFKVLDQSISFQFKTMLERDFQKLLMRSRNEELLPQIIGEDLLQLQDNVDVAAKHKYIISQTYFDKDFYGDLLKSLIELSSSGRLLPGGMLDIASNELLMNAAARQKKSKKNIRFLENVSGDAEGNTHQRTSKGRKLRYIPIPELKCFMTAMPIERTRRIESIPGIFDDKFISRMMNSLFAEYRC